MRTAQKPLVISESESAEKRMRPSSGPNWAASQTRAVQPMTRFSAVWKEGGRGGREAAYWRRVEVRSRGSRIDFRPETRAKSRSFGSFVAVPVGPETAAEDADLEAVATHGAQGRGGEERG